MPQGFNETDIEKAIENITHDLLKSHPDGESIVLIGIIENGVHIAKRIQQRLYALVQKRVPLGKLDISLFRNDLEDSSYIQIQQTQIPCKLKGKTIILVNDFLDEGHDIYGAFNALLDFDKPHSIELAVLMDTLRVRYPFKGSYIGLPLPDSPLITQPTLQLFEKDGEDSVTFN